MQEDPMQFRRILMFSGSVAAVSALYLGCGTQDASTPKSYRDVVAMRQCTDGQRYWVACMDGTTEVRSVADLNSDNVCLGQTLMAVIAEGGTILGRVSTGPNCFLPQGTNVTLKQPPTMLDDFQALVQPVSEAIAGCTITSGIVLRADVTFSAPSYPSYPSIPSYPDTASYPCG
jgi:hypothetical protein